VLDWRELSAPLVRFTSRANTARSPAVYGCWLRLTRNTACCSTTCCESLTGRTADALEHLRRAIDLAGQFRGDAKHDSDLDPIRDQPAFKRLTNDQ
jgi:hypothetical protein